MRTNPEENVIFGHLLYSTASDAGQILLLFSCHMKFSIKKLSFEPYN